MTTNLIDPGEPLAYEPLESYAALGDSRTVALVGSRGQVDWMPLPDLRTTPFFARLVDKTHGGTFLLEPTAPYSVERRYRPGTNVLETTYTTDTGKAVVTDALNIGVSGLLPWCELARRIESVSGGVEFAWRVQPGTLLREVSPWIEDTDRGAVIRCADITAAVVGSGHNPDPVDEHSQDVQLTGRFTARDGSRHVVALVGTQDEPLRLPEARLVDEGIERTAESWERWSSEFSYEGPWAEEVQRSALALKLLTHSPTGSMVAAATAGLPESETGGKNWDYRFAWVRDLAYSVSALARFGLREETHAALSWVTRVIRRNGSGLDVFYDLEGNASSHVHEREAPGWRGLGPVVTGNPAQGQLQLGVYADVFAICRGYVEAGSLLDRATAMLLEQLADRVCDLWRHRDHGMWELGEVRHYTSSKMGCWQALRDAVHLAETGHVGGNPARWRVERDKVRAWIEEHAWNEDRGAYVMYPGAQALDASVFLHATSGFDRGERMSRTIDAISEDLGSGELLYRYTGMADEEKTFVACAFWRVCALVEVGRVEEAEELMERLVHRTNDVGLFSEMIDADDGSFWGNLPQALSHLALIEAALALKDAGNGGEH
ncbi:glycoside hydrolase family 15 protein [Corynebacterium halotolerans]|uniref:Glycoside hydrolase family protein n=1 Tax=Corynebacterium halotolerans YIM 70093 = DSM 44683 TaxID=1121362 RepID=M1NSR0_9CORY|nr:glycoside hydrolase family 15 protein [Corynebacterium halotolerans]AGF72477.1 glycoside hydrolase family protein [Corynebacterium halotolerans YIM 70093 = DSM 44683]